MKIKSKVWAVVSIVSGLYVGYRVAAYVFFRNYEFVENFKLFFLFLSLLVALFFSILFFILRKNRIISSLLIGLGILLIIVNLAGFLLMLKFEQGFNLPGYLKSCEIDVHCGYIASVNCGIEHDAPYVFVNMLTGKTMGTCTFSAPPSPGSVKKPSNCPPKQWICKPSKKYDYLW